KFTQSVNSLSSWLHYQNNSYTFVVLLECIFPGAIRTFLFFSCLIFQVQPFCGFISFTTASDFCRCHIDRSNKCALFCFISFSHNIRKMIGDAGAIRMSEVLKSNSALDLTGNNPSSFHSHEIQGTLLEILEQAS